MKTKIVIALAAGIAVLVLVWSVLQVASSSASEAALPETARADAPAPEPGAPAIAALEESVERESIETTGEAGSGRSRRADGAAAEPERASSETKLRGRVLDSQGRPVAGVEIFVGPFTSDPARGIRLQPSAVFGLRDREIGAAEDGLGGDSAGNLGRKPTLRLGASGKEGRFELPRLPDGTMLHARGDGQVPVLAYDWYGSDPGDPEAILVVAAPSAVAGVVVDEHGRPIEGVEIAVQVPENLKPSLGLILDRAQPLEYFCRSGPDGHFEIADAPGVAGRNLSATREGSPSQGQPIAADPQTNIRFVFQLGQEIRVAARGIVLDAEGRPVVGASVRLGQATTRTLDDGRFLLDASAAEPGFQILAGKPGLTPGRADFDPQREESVVRLGPPTLRLAGRVVDGNGHPLVSVEVRALDLTRVDGVALEDLATWDGPGPFTQCDTDPEGRFEIAGLQPRAYALGLLDRRTMRTMRTDPIQAGKKDAEIRFGAGDATGRIAGRVVDRAGGGVPGAEVWLVREIAREDGGQRERVEIFARADGEGGFEFPDVALDVRSARVAFPGDLSVEHPIEDGQDLASLVLVAFRRAHLQVDLSGSSVEADSFEVVDGAGSALPIAKYEGNTAMSMFRWPINGELSDALGALDSAEAVVLYHRGAEVSRIPVRLVPGQLTVVRP